MELFVNDSYVLSSIHIVLGKVSLLQTSAFRAIGAMLFLYIITTNLPFKKFEIKSIMCGV